MVNVRGDRADDRGERVAAECSTQDLRELALSVRNVQHLFAVRLRKLLHDLRQHEETLIDVVRLFELATADLSKSLRPCQIYQVQLRVLRGKRQMQRSITLLISGDNLTRFRQSILDEYPEDGVRATRVLMDVRLPIVTRLFAYFYQLTELFRFLQLEHLQTANIVSLNLVFTQLQVHVGLVE